MNAKEEILEVFKKVLERGQEVECAIVWRLEGEERGDDYIKLKVGYTPSDYTKFLQDLDFVYDNGYGAQELDGFIWIKNRDYWYGREEYDGAEGWVLRKKPVIPEALF